MKCLWRAGPQQEGRCGFRSRSHRLLTDTAIRPEASLPRYGAHLSLSHGFWLGGSSKLHGELNIRGIKFSHYWKDQVTALFSSCSPKSEMDFVPTIGINSDDLWRLKFPAHVSKSWSVKASVTFKLVLWSWCSNHLTAPFIIWNTSWVSILTKWHVNLRCRKVYF